MRNDRYRRAAATGLAVLLTAALPMQALAAQTPSPAGDYAQEMARLQDNNLEYDEIEGLIKNYYAPIKSAYDMSQNQTLDSGSIADNERIVAEDLISQAQVAEDLAKEQSGMDAMISKATAQALRKNASQMRSAASSMDRSLSQKSSMEKQLDRQTNMLVMNVQSLMNQYEQLLSQRTVAAKGLELSQTARALQQTMQSQGLAVDADVLGAAAQLSTTQSQLNSLDAGLEQMHKMLCSFTGWGTDGNPVIGQVPSADVAVISTIDVNADKEKAVNNSYALISMRGQTGGGMTDLQIRTSKTTTQKANKLRNVEYSENTVRSDIQTLYDTILEKKAAYDSAATAWESAKLTWNAAQIQRQSGTLSTIQFQQQELAYLQAQSGFRCADLSLQQAIQDYTWAVTGVEVAVQ